MKMIGCYKIDDDGRNLFYGFYLKVDILLKWFSENFLAAVRKSGVIINPGYRQSLTSQQSCFMIYWVTGGSGEQ